MGCNGCECRDCDKSVFLRPDDIILPLGKMSRFDSKRLAFWYPRKRLDRQKTAQNRHSTRNSSAQGRRSVAFILVKNLSMEASSCDSVPHAKNNCSDNRARVDPNDRFVVTGCDCGGRSASRLNPVHVRNAAPFCATSWCHCTALPQVDCPRFQASTMDADREGY